MDEEKPYRNSEKKQLHTHENKSDLKTTYQKSANKKNTADGPFKILDA